MTRFDPILRGLLLAGGTVFALALIIPTLGRGAGQAMAAAGTMRAGHPGVEFLSAFTDDDGLVHDSGRDGRDDGIDAGLTWDVATCNATLQGRSGVRLAVDNAYPGYTCTIWAVVKNAGNQPLSCGRTRIRAPKELSLSAVSQPPCRLLGAGQQQILRFTLRVGEAAEEGAFYSFSVLQRFSTAAENDD